MRDFRVLVNGRPINVLLAAAQEGIATSRDDVRTVAVSVDAPDGEVTVEVDVKSGATKVVGPKTE